VHEDVEVNGYVVQKASEVQDIAKEHDTVVLEEGECNRRRLHRQTNTHRCQLLPCTQETQGYARKAPGRTSDSGCAW